MFQSTKLKKVTMSLFIREDFISHAGLPLTWKVECDSLTESDYIALAKIVSEKIKFRDVFGIPRGGIPFEKALKPYASFSKNDTLGQPWFAPAGFNRTTLSNVIESTMVLKQENLDSLYDTKINPITAFSGTSLVIWGQKTLQQAANALDRINVRRLLIEIRRLIRDASNQIIFEPNREETLVKFRNLVNPILQNVQENQGLTRYKVVIDTTTTTQADVENNTIRGKIILQPTKTIEFVALDFVVTNNGTEI